MGHYDEFREKQVVAWKSSLITPIITPNIEEIKTNVVEIKEMLKTLINYIELETNRSSECHHNYDDIREGLLYCTHCGESA